MYSLLLIVFVFNFIYEDSDSLIIYEDTLTRCGYHSYNVKVHLRNAMVTVTPWSGASDSTGWLLLESPTIMCEPHTTIHGIGDGYWGGTAGHGDGYGPGAGMVGGISGGGGGGAGYGGAGGDGGDYYPGSGGGTYGNPIDTSIAVGSGGGAGQYSGVIDGYGGSGGAMVTIRGQNVSADSLDIIVNGQTGEAGYIGFEGGGGGSGGGILVLCDTAVLHDTYLTVCGGDGAGSEYGGGGGGGGGRIKVLYTTQLDTMFFLAAAHGGNGGTGYQGSDGEPGDSGSIHIAPIVGIEEHAANISGLTVVNGTIVRRTMILSCARTPAVLSIYDASGQVVLVSTLISQTTRLPVHGLPKGVYFLSLNERPARCIKIVVIR